jgi:hypothetical protein
MPPNGYFRGAGSLIGQAIACAAIALLLFARSAPPNVPRTHVLQATFNGDNHHEQRPCFDHQGPQWGTPVSPFPLPTPVTTFQPLRTTEPFVALQENGFYYNRPPPPAF